MKKLLILSTTLALSATCFAQDIENKTQQTPVAPSQINNQQKEIQKPQKPDFEKKRQEFETRLKLTDEQKAKAKALREQGRKDIEPLMNEIKTKHEKIKSLEAQNPSQEELEKTRIELRELHKKIHDQRIKNMKDFESILNKKQLEELKKIKEEGRKDFKRRHHK